MFQESVFSTKIFISVGDLSNVLNILQGSKIRKGQKGREGRTERVWICGRSAADPCAIDSPWGTKPGLGQGWSLIPRMMCGHRWGSI